MSFGDQLGKVGGSLMGAALAGALGYLIGSGECADMIGGPGVARLVRVEARLG